MVEISDATTAYARNDHARLRNLAAIARSRGYPGSMQTLVAVHLRILDNSAVAAEIRANWALLVLTADRLGNYEPLVLARATLDRASGEVEASRMEYVRHMEALMALYGL